MQHDDMALFEARESWDASAPIGVLRVGLLLIVLAIPAYLWLREMPPIWDATTPPQRITFCGLHYHDPQRLGQPLAADPTVIEPIVEAVDGERLRFPDVQTTRLNGSDVCTTVLEIHDAGGWVLYSLVGGP